MSSKRRSVITKTLSRNDTGETGGHQAGILVPKNPAVLSFFPALGFTEKNPRHMLTFSDELGEKWTFAFIYYNNSLFGGTRNEYRLTRMTPFIRGHNLQAGDALTLHRSRDGYYSITYQRKHQSAQRSDGTLRLGSSWKVVRI